MREMIDQEKRVGLCCVAVEVNYRLRNRSRVAWVFTGRIT